MLFRNRSRSVPAARREDRPSPARDAVPCCLEAVVEASAEVLCNGAAATDDPLCGELLGSDASGIWWMPSGAYGAPGQEFEQRIGAAYAASLGRRGGSDGLAALRALQAGAAPEIASAVAPVAARIAAEGVDDPVWWPRTAGLRPVRAAELSGADDAHRSRIVFVEFERDGTRMTLGVLTDAAAAGIAASIGVFDALELVGESIERALPGDACAQLLRPIEIADASVAMRRAIERTDLLGTVDAYGPGFVGYRALALRWTAAIP